MKSFFSRLRKDPLPLAPPDSSSSRNKETEKKTALDIPEKSSRPTTLAPLTLTKTHSHSSSSSESSRPRSEQAPSHTEAEPEVWDSEKDVRARAASHGQDGMRKVTFRNTPLTSMILDNITPPVDGEEKPSQGILQPPHSLLKPVLHLNTRTTSAQSVSSRPRPFSIASYSLQRPFTSRKSSLPPQLSQPGSASPTKSTFSRTPSESSTRSYLAPPNSWSEMAEEDLVANLGPRERTRQEVLWEIVSSEERYVTELIKLNDTFSRSLLPPSATSPSLNLFDPTQSLSRTLSPSSTPSTPREPMDHLPIAARYASYTRFTQSPDIPEDGTCPPQPSQEKENIPTPPPSATARKDAYNILTNGRPRKQPSSTTLNGKSRSHNSMPPLPRNGSSLSNAVQRLSFPGNREGRNVSGSSTSSIMSVTDVELPEDLEKVLMVLSGGILQGHLKLAAALRKRYENQYPLVRSLADVFTAHSYILREYATYVLHLERALSQVDHALSLATRNPKRTSRTKSESPTIKLGKHLLALEEIAAERGESGLSISLSKPFQRLLKYPLLFQNLLFNTDPSLKEYEATLGMVDSVEEIVRSIEDEKSSSEEREKTRDVWARIEGLERDKSMMAPKPDRLLVSETQIPRPDGTMPQSKEDTVRQKKSVKRFSDMFKHTDLDLWIIRFTDVSLLCEKTGTTSLPSSSNSNKLQKRSESVPELNGRRGFGGTRRVQSMRARNLYRFVKVHEWDLKQNSGSAEGLLSMDDISQARTSQAIPSAPTATLNDAPPKFSTASTPSTPEKPLKVPIKINDGPTPTKSPQRVTIPATDGDAETIVSDRLSVMSFAFKGSDQVKPIRLRPVPRTISATSSSSPAIEQRRNSGGHIQGHAANAKFAHRLRANEPGDITVRPSNKDRRSLPPAMAARPEILPTALGNTMNAVNMNPTASGRVTPTVVKPRWNGSTSITPTAKAMAGTGTGIGQRGTGQGSNTVSSRRGVVKRREVTPPSPSEDSGVAGLWIAASEGVGEDTPKATRIARGGMI